MFLVALAIGTVVGGVAVTIAKSIGRDRADEVPADAVDELHVHPGGAAAGSARPVNA
jgi:PTS system fructose-specific IIC component